jgi:hypothetical protein
MTQDEIIEMARQADIRDSLEYDHMECDIESLEAFAKLVAQHEREQCKKLCEWKTGNQFVDEAVAVCYRAIDQRGQA